MDLVGSMGTSDKRKKYILAVINIFTRFLITTSLRSNEAAEVTRAFYRNVVCIHGVPRTVVTDQGKKFVNQIFDEIAVRDEACNSYGI